MENYPMIMDKFRNHKIFNDYDIESQVS